MLDGMRNYIDKNRVADFQDHHYSAEMSVSGMLQTFLIDENENSIEKFLNKFDTDWIKYNRDLIEKTKKFSEISKFYIKKPTEFDRLFVV